MKPLTLRSQTILRAFATATLFLDGSRESYAELVAAGLVELGQDAQLTPAGARELAELLERDERARPCRCAHPRDAHRDDAPHDCLVCSDCRSFTAAAPLVAP